MPQLAENAQLGEFGDARQEHETQVRVAALQRAVEIAHDVAQHRKVCLFMHHVQQRGIIFIDKDNDLTTGLLINTLNQVGQPYIAILQICRDTKLTLLPAQLEMQVIFQLFPIHVFALAHVKMQHRVRLPFLLQLFDGQALEQFLPPFEKGV